MSEEKLTQQHVQDLAGRHQQYQYQAESLSQQMNMVQMTIRDVETAIITITSLKGESPGKETLVPIGFNSFIKATITNTDKVVIGVGAGVSIEKKIDDAKTFLEKRKDELIKYNEKLTDAVSKLAQEMRNIENIVQNFERSQQPMKAE